MKVADGLPARKASYPNKKDNNKNSSRSCASSFSQNTHIRTDRVKEQLCVAYCGAFVKSIYRGMSGFEASLDFRNKLVAEVDADEEVADESKDLKIEDSAVLSEKTVGLSKSLTYGEVVPESFIQILRFISKSASPSSSSKSSVILKGSFVDLGCGIGRACIVAALQYSNCVGNNIHVDSIVGIDIVPELIAMANRAKSRLSMAIELAREEKEKEKERETDLYIFQGLSTAGTGKASAVAPSPSSNSNSCSSQIPTEESPVDVAKIHQHIKDIYSENSKINMNSNSSSNNSSNNSGSNSNNNSNRLANIDGSSNKVGGKGKDKRLSKVSRNKANNKNNHNNSRNNKSNSSKSSGSDDDDDEDEDDIDGIDNKSDSNSNSSKIIDSNSSFINDNDCIIESSIEDKATVISHDILACPNLSLRLQIDFVANKLCTLLGHKLFRAFVKHYKSFNNFLKGFPDRYMLYLESFELSLFDEVNVYASDVDVELKTEITSTSEGNNTVSDNSHSNGDNRNEKLAVTKERESEQHIVDQASKLIKTNLLEIINPLIDISYITNDIFAENWWDGAAVAYAASLLFTDAMMEQLSSKVAMMPLGSWFISLRPLLSQPPCSASPSTSKRGRVVLMQESFYKMSWQMAKVYIYQIQEQIA